MADIIVTLTTAQVQQGLVYARKVFPEATNADLTAKLEEAAYYGPGIRLQIADWERQATRADENTARQEAQDQFVAVYPPASPVPDPEPEPVAATTAAKTTRKKKA